MFYKKTFMSLLLSVGFVAFSGESVAMERHSAIVDEYGSEVCRILPRKEALVNRREINQIRNIFASTELLDRIYVDCRLSTAVGDIVTALVNESADLKSSERANIFQLFITKSKGRAILLKYADTPFMKNAMFAYYRALCEQMKQDSKKQRERRATLPGEISSFLPLVPVEFRESIFMRCKAEKIDFYSEMIGGRTRVQSVISDLGRIRVAVDHLNYKAVEKNRELADKLSLLFDDETGNLCVHLKKNKERTILDYAVVLSSLFSRMQSVPPSEEEQLNAAKIVRVAGYFFDEHGIAQISRLERLSSRNQGLLLFTYANALNASNNPIYETFATQLLSGGLSKKFYEYCTLHQQIRVRMSYAQHLYDMGKFRKAMRVLGYYLFGSAGRRIITEYQDDSGLRSRIFTLYNKCKRASKK